MNLAPLGFNPGDRPTTICVAGPTASGKSDLALQLAIELSGEIICADSMQVYRGMDIGTAKPSRMDRARAPHHLLDVIDLTETFDVARFISLARKAEQEIHSRNRIAIFCGGTGLYFKAYFHGLADAPPSDAAMRRELESTPMPALLEELARKDPDLFQTIDRKNPRRVIRALEVIRQTGRPYSVQRRAAPWSPSDEGKARRLGIEWPLDKLRRRIDQRVDWMFEQGLVEETRRLIGLGLRENATASQALGYKQVIEYLDGRASLEQAIELVKLRTRQYAKRQLTWFRTQFPLRWIPAESLGC